MSRGIAVRKIKITLLGKVKIIIRKTILHLEKRQSDEGWLMEVLDKKAPHSSNYTLVAKVQQVLTIVRPIIRTIIVT